MRAKYQRVYRFNRVLYQLNTINKTMLRCFLPKQIDCLRKADSNDLLAVLPTAYGKSLIFQALPYLSDPPTQVIVASPLSAIILEQKQKLKDAAIVVNEEFVTALASSKPSDDVQRFCNGNFTYLLGHPEHLTLDKFLMELKSIDAKFSHIVVDEAHCVLSYGVSDFRPAFLRLKYLKVFLPRCHILAMTATASLPNSKKIAKELGMQDALTVRLPPDRTNIFIGVHRRPPSVGSNTTVERSYDHQLDQIISELAADPEAFPKTIVYLPLKWCAYAHKKACLALGIDFTGSDMTDEEGLICTPVAQYHAAQGTQVQYIFL